MPGIRSVFEKGSPLTFFSTTIANGGNMKAGIMVEPDGTTGKIKPATAGTKRSLGVLVTSTAASDYASSDTTDSWGNPVINEAAVYPVQAAVACMGVWKLKVTGAVVFGQRVKCGAAGIIVPFVDGTDALDLCIGRCVDAAGIADQASGRIRLGVM